MLYHNSHDEAFRLPLGPLKCGEILTVRFLCNESTTPLLRTWDGEESVYPMTCVGENLYEASVRVPRTPMLFWYDFMIPTLERTVRYGNSAGQLGGAGMRTMHQPASYQVTVYDPAYTTPAFLRDGVIYQIFPDRFNRGANGQNGREAQIRQAHPEATFHENWNEAPDLNLDPQTGDNMALDFFGGTLQGITEKLDYLQGLGVSVLYINPVFRARTNHRYDTGSYEEIDPILGTREDFEELTRQAAARGMRILLDGVFSHTGSDSLYFNKYARYPEKGACQGEDSEYYPWYTFYEYPKSYRTWWGFQTLPTVDKNNPDYRRYLLNEENGVLPRWVKEGASGWRLDVVDELPMDMVAQIRTAVKGADPDAAVIGEVWEDASNKVSYGVARSYCLGDTLDSVMNYPLRRGVIDFMTGSISAQELCTVILHQQEVYPAPFYYSLMNLLDSHDRVRILNAMSGYDREGAAQMDRVQAREIRLTDEQLKTAKKRYLAALKIICALPGAPTVYYGDELGMQGMADPWNRAPMDWEHADEALRGAVRELLTKRRGNPVLQRGFLKVEAPDADTIVIKRSAKAGRDVFGEPLQGRAVTVKVKR